MAEKLHHYRPTVTWTGNTGTGTSSYRAYGRSHVISAPGRADILGSSDPGFRGDGTRWNPEDLLVASVSTCHQLWYLHLCSDAGVVVLEYRDAPEGVMVETADGGGHFTKVTLRPTIRIAPGGDVAKAQALHHDAHEKCFVANSVNFPIAVEAVITS
jgi:organic hydroperoxide reductase OsmC/OhrA